jgi:hypothetical protein
MRQPKRRCAKRAKPTHSQVAATATAAATKAAKAAKAEAEAEAEAAHLASPRHLCSAATTLPSSSTALVRATV